MAPTTADLGSRSQPAKKELPEGLLIETRCGGTWCADGLSVRGKVLIAPALSADEAGWVDEGSLERVIRVDWWNDSFVSVYVAESSFAEGAAHANNSLRCRTFDLKSGRALSLRDILSPKSADLLLAKVGLLSDPEVALVELGEDLEYGYGYKLDPTGFRLTRPGKSLREKPEIILCAEGDSPSVEGTIVEMRVDALPVEYLLRGSP